MALTAFQFLAERQDRLAQALTDNPQVAEFVQAVLEHLIDRAEERGEALQEIAVASPVIVQEGSSFYVSARIT